MATGNSSWETPFWSVGVGRYVNASCVNAPITAWNSRGDGLFTHGLAHFLRCYRGYEATTATPRQRVRTVRGVYRFSGTTALHTVAHRPPELRPTAFHHEHRVLGDGF